MEYKTQPNTEFYEAKIQHFLSWYKRGAFRSDKIFINMS